MTKMTDYRVMREHEGDKFYAPGDTRAAHASDVKHLVPHVLEEIIAEKADRESDNKMEQAPANKSGRKPKGE